MGQSPRQIVEAAVRFTGPERIPVVMECLGVSDIAWIPRKSLSERRADVEVDEWGCVWERADVPGMGQVKGHPLCGVRDWERLKAPDYDQDWIYEDVGAALARAEGRDAYTQAGLIMTLFERMHMVAGFENVLVGLIADREAAAALADKILAAQLRIVRNLQETCGRRLHSFFLTDDWGSQSAAFVSPELWNDFFLPRYRRLFEAIHGGGQAVWMHTCGKVNDLIEGFITAGLDVVSLQQPRALGIEAIGRRYRGRIAFESISDVQVSLGSGRLEPIRRDAETLGEHWMLPAGGFILRECDPDSAAGAHPDAWRVMHEAFSRVSERLYGRPLPRPVLDQL